MTRARTAWRLRLPVLALVTALVLVLRALAPDPGMRRASLLLVALGLGYGHQLGALHFARRRQRAALEWALLGATALSAAVAFALGLASDAAPWLLLALAWLAAWHVLENDLALSRGSAGSLRLPPLARRLAPHLAAAGAAALVVGAALGAPRAAPSLVGAGIPSWLAVWTPEEVIAALLLYHSATWLGRGLVTPSRTQPGWTAHRSAILIVHALPLLALAGARELAPVFYAWVVSPPIYLFLSAAHACHTCLERGFEAA